MSKTSNFRSDIQGLRAVAVLTVFLFHLDARLLSGGFVGVDVFFVISGFLMTGIILGKKDKGSFSFPDFYLGRLKRLFPVYLLCVATVLAACALLYMPPDMFNLRNAAAYSLSFLSNVYYSKLDTYFGASSLENPLLHTWTLAVEMQFYFLLPLLLIFLPKKYLPMALVLLIVAGFGWSYYNAAVLLHKASNYYSLMTRIPEFLLGSLAALYYPKPGALGLRRHSLLAALSLAGILLSAYFFSESTNFPGFWVLVPCLSTAVLLLTSESAVNRFLGHPALQFLGNLSYSIYLIHWPIMAIVRYHFDEIHFSWATKLMITAATLGLSYLSFRWLEEGTRKFSTKKFLIWLAVPTLATGLLLFKSTDLNKKILNVPLENIAPSFGLESHGSHFQQVQVLGDASYRGKNILLIGDSNALVFKNFFDQLGKHHHFSVRTLTNDIYPNIPGIRRAEIATEGNNEQYQKILQATQPEIARAEVVIFVSAYSPEVPSIIPAAEQYFRELSKTKKVVLLKTYPLVSPNPIKINKGFVRKENRENHYTLYPKSLPPALISLAAANPNLRIIDIDYAHWPGVDMPFKDNKSLYYDERHLNKYGTDALEAAFGDKVYAELNEFVLLHHD